MRRFNATMVERVMTTMRLPDDVPIEHKMVSKAIKSAQTQVEQINMEQRKDVLKYDEVMNEQRKVIYAERHRVLAGENMRDQIEGMLRDVVNAYVDGATSSGYSEDWDHEKLWTALKQLYPVSIDWEDLVEDGDLDAHGLREALLQDARNAYDKREAEINALVGPDGMRTLEHQVMLTVLDRKWREHLYEMDYLKQGIGMRALAQRDPLIEYQREGFDMFRAMLDSLKEEAVGFLFNLQVERAEAPPAEDAAALPTGVPVGNGQAAEGRHARPAPPQPQAPTTDTESVPAALRGKGLGSGGGQQSGLTLSGPGEDGEVEAHAEGADAAGGGGSSSRRDRRAAQRDAAKKGKKGPRR
jgi:preprotein translocase subunit SecA